MSVQYQLPVCVTPADDAAAGYFPEAMLAAPWARAEHWLALSPYRAHFDCGTTPGRAHECTRRAG